LIGGGGSTQSSSRRSRIRDGSITGRWPSMWLLNKPFLHFYQLVLA
jgi:hypothetical protein